MKQDIQNGMKLVNVNVDQIQLFLVINNVGIKINADVNIKIDYNRIEHKGRCDT